MKNPKHNQKIIRLLCLTNEREVPCKILTQAPLFSSGRFLFLFSDRFFQTVRLRQLRISGFKSFADTTVIEFPGAVAGIVGPNGCGKSNVIDAIRWVLGEARISELRGSSSMSELIFAGSLNRPASSRASVELVLDNSDGTIKGAWGRYTELSVKRIVTRDGSNAYLINNLQVRRRDVQDIFMGTGLGPRSYAIISQGMISNFIKAKPEELRVYLEEAAGVSKYKERRRETESALAGTRANLEKVSYLQQSKREEIERLQAEAEVAARWQTLTEQKNEAELLWYFLQECDAKAAVDKVNVQIARRESDLLESRGELQRLSAGIETLKDEAREKRELADKAREIAWQGTARVKEIEGEIARIVSEKASIERELASASESLARRQNERDAAVSRIGELQAQLREFEFELEACREESAAAEEELETARETNEAKKEAYENARRESTQQESRIQVLGVELQALARETNDAQMRLEAIESDRRLSQAPDEERFAELAELIAEAEAGFEELAASLEENAQRLEERKQQCERTRRRRERLAQEHARTAARLQALEAVQLKAQSEGKLAQWLVKMGLDKSARVYEKIRVDEGWTAAVEALLGVRAAAIGSGVLERTAGFEFDPPPARLVFYGQKTQDAVSAARPGLQPLTGKVHSDDERVAAVLSVWLAGAYVASTLEEALTRREELAAGERFVTPRGHVVDAVSVSFWAEDSETTGALSRSAEIRTLTEKAQAEREELDATDEALVRAQAELSQAEMRRAEDSRRAEACRGEMHALQVEHSALSAAVAAWKEKSRRAEDQAAELKMRLEEMAARQEELDAEFETADRNLSHVQQKALEAKLELERAEQTLSGLLERTRTQQSRIQMMQVHKRTHEERVRDAQERKAGAEEEIERLSERMQELAARREELDEDAQREGLDRVLAELEAKNEAHRAAEELSRQAEQALEQARARTSELAAAQTPMLQEIADLKVRRESWVTQSAVFTERLDAAQADRAALQLRVQQDGLRASGLKTQVTRLDESIASLGAVNHAALENLQESRRAMQETERQVADLEEAIENLTASIRRIDAETRELLKGTFEEVNRNFSEMFTGLFGGGSAQLSMTGDEILESGIEVSARPPGKKNASVKLLSGGEQAMTATALVFAIFKLNPAPFCLLDEVDAPLDEANQERLAKRILQMSANTQFMMITHHRVTMEHLRTLVGVTMKEPGVSRVVSVDVEEASEMAAQ